MEDSKSEVGLSDSEVFGGRVTKRPYTFRERGKYEYMNKKRDWVSGK